MTNEDSIDVPPQSSGEPPTSPTRHQIARIVLVTFLFTFIAARVLVLLIMLQKIPDLFLHVGQTHVHHLNYGIFLLSGVGAFLLFEKPVGRQLTFAATIYAVGLALTFDEFGMWVHLGGSYWQRASFDAVIVISAILGLIAEAPRLKRFKTQHWLATAGLGIAVIIFAGLLVRSLQFAGQRLGPTLRQIEEMGPR